MPRLVNAPTTIPAPGEPQKRIDEYVGRVNTGDSTISVAHMRSPAGWAEPGQRPDFRELTLVLAGRLRVEHEGGVMLLASETLDRAFSLRGDTVREALLVGGTVGAGLPALVATRSRLRVGVPLWLVQVALALGFLYTRWS